MTSEPFLFALGIHSSSARYLSGSRQSSADSGVAILSVAQESSLARDRVITTGLPEDYTDKPL
jgi:hypothetical protein